MRRDIFDIGRIEGLRLCVSLGRANWFERDIFNFMLTLKEERLGNVVAH